MSPVSPALAGGFFTPSVITWPLENALLQGPGGWRALNTGGPDALLSACRDRCPSLHHDLASFDGLYCAEASRLEFGSATGSWVTECHPAHGCVLSSGGHTERSQPRVATNCMRNKIVNHKVHRAVY